MNTTTKSSDRWLQVDLLYLYPLQGLSTTADAVWTSETVVFTTFGTVFGTLAGYGFVNFVQSTLDTNTLKALMRLAHAVGGIVWLLPYLTCNAGTFVLLCLNTFAWGAEPYDNLMSREMWAVVRRRAAAGDKLHLYWAVSSLIIHIWFCYGSAVLTMGVYRPSWLPIAIAGFVCSHLARLAAMDHADTAASVLEMVGVLTVACVTAISFHDDPIEVTLWLLVVVLERFTHIPSALRRDAGWMRSFDLWAEASGDPQAQDTGSSKGGQESVAAPSAWVMNPSKV